MKLIDLYKYIEEEKQYKLIAAFVYTDITKNIINDLKELSKKHKYKYTVQIKEYITNKSDEIIQEFKIT